MTNFSTSITCVFCSIINNLKDFGQKLDLNNYLFGSLSPENTPCEKFVFNLFVLTTNQKQLLTNPSNS